MKKSLILTLAAGFACAMSSMATTYDLYITGATAFRANVFDSCRKIFDTLPATNITMSAGTLVFGGNNIGNNGSSMWTMSGTVNANVPALGTGNQLVIHADFNGSVQGVYVTENSTPIQFLDTAGNLITNTPTIGFSDVDSAATPYPVSGTANFAQESVAIQPFVWCTSIAASNLINNVTYEQAVFGIKQGKIALSVWSNNNNDNSTPVYIVQRTRDSGTRRNLFAENGYAYGYSAPVYIYNETGANWHKAAGGLVNANPATNTTCNVIGAAGAGNANVDAKWSYGYVGGGDIKRVLGTADNNSANLSIGFLSLADAKAIVSGAGNVWSQVVALNGLWPTTAGIGIRGNAGTNDFSPITSGTYTAWGEEVVVYPKDPSLIAGQNLTTGILGNQTTAGTILGVLDYQTYYSGGSPIVGSIENEIELSKLPANGPATAIRLSDMHSSRSSVGGTITP